MRAHSAEYLAYMESDAWRLKRMAVLGRAGGECERCKAAPAVDVHHLTYQHLGDEPLADLQALCRPCHDQADRTRIYRKRRDAYARKRYGSDWQWHHDEDAVDDEFQAFLERQEGRP